MNCPKCGSLERQGVKETRTSLDGRITRRRHCPDCAHDFWTVEQLADTRLQVRKSDGRIVAFSREAVRRSMVEAAVRKYDPDRINQLIDSVIDDVYPMSEAGFVESSKIADSVLRHFREIDEVSQIRFALVHMGRNDRTDGRLGWNDVRDVRRWLREEYPELQYNRPPSGVIEVVKRNGEVEPFNFDKLAHGVAIAAKGRGSSEGVQQLAAAVAGDVESELGDQPRITSGQIASEILRSLRRRDHIAFLRFASTVKQFRSPADYENEIIALRNVKKLT